MSKCTEFEPLIEQMLSEEIEDASRDRLLAHSEACVDCRQFVDLHYQLQDPELSTELPSDAELAEVRANVLREIRAADRNDPLPSFGLAGLLRLFALRPAYGMGLAAMLLVMLGTGVVVGRWTTGPELPNDLFVADDLVQEILRREAQTNRELADVEDSRYLYSNVVFDERDDGRVALSFDVTRHVQVDPRQDDPLVKEVLAQTLVNPMPVGTRLRAISFADRVDDPKVEQALIFSMLNDENLAVRLRAFQILAGAEPSEEIEAAMLMVLSTEEAVQLRMLAMDWVAASDAGQERMDEVLEQLQESEDRALLVRAASYESTEPDWTER